MDGGAVVVVLVLGRLLWLGLDQQGARETDAALVVGHHLEEPGQLVGLLTHPGVQQGLVALPAHPRARSWRHPGGGWPPRRSGPGRRRGRTRPDRGSWPHLLRSGDGRTGWPSPTAAGFGCPTSSEPPGRPSHRGSTSTPSALRPRAPCRHRGSRSRAPPASGRTRKPRPALPWPPPSGRRCRRARAGRRFHGRRCRIPTS